jgi:hypothetical protein
MTLTNLVEAWPVDLADEDEVRERRQQGWVSGRIWVWEWTVGLIWVREGWIFGRRRDLASVGIPAGDPTGSQIWPSVGFSCISDPAIFLKPTLAKRGFPAESGQISGRPLRGERERESTGERETASKRGECRRDILDWWREEHFHLYIKCHVNL